MLRALFIDDDADFLAGVTENATQEGFEVTGAGSLAEGRRNLALGLVDLVLIDLVLPDGDGIELLREIKETSSSDVIIVSGTATVDSAIEALRLGALDLSPSRWTTGGSSPFSPTSFACDRSMQRSAACGANFASSAGSAG